MKHFSLILMSIMLFSSCVQKDDHNNEKTNNLKLEESNVEIRIPIDSKTSCESQCIQFFHDEGNDYLAILNKYENAIQIYNIEDTTMETKIKFEVKGGENATGVIKGFKIINKDTVFLSSYFYNIFLTNFNGDIHKKINYWRPTRNGNYPSFSYCWTTVDGSFIYKAPKLLIGQKLIQSKDNLVKYGPDISSKVCLELDIQSENLKFLEMDHPLYRQKEANKVTQLFARVYNGSEFVYAPCADHFIYITKDHKTVTAKKIKSCLLSENQFGIIGNYIKSNTIKKSLVNGAKSGRYLNMLYDKYRKVYYRFVKLPSDVGNKYRADIDYTNDNISIMLLDDKFNIVDELPLSENLYHWKMSFVNEKGLFISTNNVNNPNFSPDYLSFNLISINKVTKQ